MSGAPTGGERVLPEVDLALINTNYALEAGLNPTKDALVIEGSEAGGHIGPVSLSVLAQEILPEIADVPVFVAGGLGRGAAIAAFLEMGASGAQLGTRFAAAAESVAHPNFKRAFVRAAARDAIASVQLDPRFPVIPVRALRNRGQEAFADKQREVIAEVDAGRLTLAEGQLAIEHYWAGALRRAVVEGDVEMGSVMAGQSVGMVSAEEPVAAIISRSKCVRCSSRCASSSLPSAFSSFSRSSSSKRIASTACLSVGPGVT